MDIVVRKAALKALRKMDAKTRNRFYDAFERIAKGKNTGLDIKALQGTEGFRLRIGDYRALYTQTFEILTIYKAGPRGDIYK